MIYIWSLGSGDPNCPHFSRWLMGLYHLYTIPIRTQMGIIMFNGVIMILPVNTVIWGYHNYYIHTYQYYYTIVIK